MHFSRSQAGALERGETWKTKGFTRYFSKGRRYPETTIKSSCNYTYY